MNPTLDETSRTRLDGIVQQMTDNKESEQNIQMVVNDFKQKYGTNTSQETPQATSQAKGFFGAKNPLMNLGVNIGAEVGKAVTGVGEAALKVSRPVANLMGLGAQNQQAQEKLQDISNKIYNPIQEQYQGLGSGVGKIVGQVAPYAMGEGEINALSKAGQGLVGKALINSPKLVNKAKFATNALAQGIGNFGIAKATNSENAGTIGVLSGLSPFGVKLLGSLGKYGLGSFSGTGADVLQRAYDNSEAVGEAVKKYAENPENKQELVEKARKAISNFIKSKSEEYGANLENIDKNTIITKNGQMYIRRIPNTEGQQLPGYKGGTALIPTEFTTKGLKDTITKTLKDFGASGSGQVFNYDEVALPKQSINKLKELVGRIYGWKNHTPTGYDKLRQIIDSYYTDGRDKSFDHIIQSMKENITNYTDERIPQVKEMRNAFSSKTKILNDFQKELQLNGNAKPSTQLNSIMRIFQKDPQLRKNMAKVMGEKNADDFMNEITGAILSEWVPKGKMGNYFRGLTDVGLGTAAAFAGGALPAVGTIATGLAAASPRIVGKAARLAGNKTTQLIGKNLLRGAIVGTNQSSSPVMPPPPSS